ncbi:MAG: hypothetical protein E7534_00770 [Ruminococcaceae bacterium]|nr:hypothetical protein [Oscillospiraceae bacterium]
MDQCEQCAYYAFDEEFGEYICDMDIGLDEDDEARRFGDSRARCPFFRFYDEYKLVQKQN